MSLTPSRSLIGCLLALASLAPSAYSQGPATKDVERPLIRGNQRVVVVMVDGLGPDYVEQSAMPVLKGLMAKGFSKTVAGVMPSVTNVNNASICCGTWPDEHGITGNSYFDEAKGQAEYMEYSACPPVASIPRRDLYYVTTCGERSGRSSPGPGLRPRRVQTAGGFVASYADHADPKRGPAWRPTRSSIPAAAIGS